MQSPATELGLCSWPCLCTQSPDKLHLSVSCAAQKLITKQRSDLCRVSEWRCWVTVHALPELAWHLKGRAPQHAPHCCSYRHLRTLPAHSASTLDVQILSQWQLLGRCLLPTAQVLAIVT